MKDLAALLILFTNLAHAQTDDLKQIKKWVKSPLVINCSEVDLSTSRTLVKRDLDQNKIQTVLVLPLKVNDITPIKSTYLGKIANTGIMNTPREVQVIFDKSSCTLHFPNAFEMGVNPMYYAKILSVENYEETDSKKSLLLGICVDDNCKKLDRKFFYRLVL